jgi:Calcium binding
MSYQPKDEEREERITMEIIVDAYNAEEQAMGWYYYLEGTMHFPFTACCVAQRAISLLEPGEEVEVLGMAPI